MWYDVMWWDVMWCDVMCFIWFFLLHFILLLLHLFLIHLSRLYPFLNIISYCNITLHLNNYTITSCYFILFYLISSHLILSCYVIMLCHHVILSYIILYYHAISHYPSLHYLICCTCHYVSDPNTMIRFALRSTAGGWCWCWCWWRWSWWCWCPGRQGYHKIKTNKQTKPDQTNANQTRPVET